MAMITQVCMGIQVLDPNWSSSGEEWELVINSGGVDALNKTVPYTRPGFGDVQFAIYSEARQFPPEGFARVYIFGVPVQSKPLYSDQISAQILFDTAQLNPSSIRFGIHGRDLIRPQHMLMWGFDAAMAVVPLTLDVDMMAEISEDVVEGPSSIPLTLVDSGKDTTPLNEVVLYVSLADDANAGTRQPTAFRIENADGAILFQNDLDDFQQLERDTRTGTDLLWSDARDVRNAKIWLLTDTTPAFSRVDTQGRTIVPKLSVTGPDNAKIQTVVAFGINRGGPHPLVVPLVHHLPEFAGTNPWIGTHQSRAGRDMILPLCQTASRQ